MDGNTKKGKLPTDIIIASFRGDLTDYQKTALCEWLSAEGNQEKYDALKRVWDNTVSNAGEFDSHKAYVRLHRRISNVWKKIAVAASVAAVAILSCTAYYLFVPSDPLLQTYTCVTGKSVVVLPDWSKVVLHQDASISYDNAFSNTNRIVELKGEAYFEVTKDVENEFVIAVGGIDIIVHGTAFNVTEDPESVTVSLIEGSVEIVAQNDLRCSLVPGQSAVYNKESGNLTSARDDVAFAACWAQDRLTFTQASLGEVCRYLSKRYGVEIVVADALQSSYSYTFTIREEPIDQILDIMSRINPMRYHYTNDHRIIISEIL